MKHLDSLIDLTAGRGGITRRRFCQGIAGLAGAVVTPGLSLAAQKSLELSIDYQGVNLTGRPARAVAVNGALPGPVLRWREGDTVNIRVHNRLPVMSAIHWHGIILPSNMDGVPGLSFDGIAPGSYYDYRFTLRQSGTYWYHSHADFQEQQGVYGAIVIDPLTPEPAHGWLA